ncbi:hypothetical protein KVR01_011783 [Diaporthe batatas]|uniref:uncharacterized protein n=1 Tax=Diaporthe batatas TaxID=748121 RepID=UPI001D04AD3F|nr:uncharacterized protein KVR01_011783 [Diaporthe batatas]KAG8158661.1 hypothetical protein KVR01_011783 [Diaporthe batatas]
MFSKTSRSAILSARWGPGVSGTTVRYLRNVSQTAPQPYACDIDAEPLHRYCAGGYHPLKLGDVLKQDRYKILHKLGWGGYSTTWAAMDRKEDRYVAVKVSVSQKSDSQEQHILRAISALPRVHPGRNHVVQMFDHFEEKGPNGTHDCLVLELLGPNVPDLIDSSYSDERLPARLAKIVARQALSGVDFLATHQIGHGDLHTGNLAFKIPVLDHLSEEHFREKIGKPETALVTRTNGKASGDPGPNVPPYLVRPTSFTKHIREGLRMNPYIKIIDFGESFQMPNAPTKLHTPLVVRPPECIFSDRLDHRVDLWSMACLLFELVTGQPPFDSIMVTPDTLIPQMMECCEDDLPDLWLEKWRQMNKIKPSDDPPCTLQEWLEEVYFNPDRDSGFTKQDIERVGYLISRMLKFEPSSRAQAKEILEDPWFSS